MIRTLWCRYAIFAAATLLYAGSACAQTWPTKPVRLISPYAAGGANDIVCRVLAEPLAASLGQPIVVDNRPGAGSVLGSTLLVQSAPDGHTIMMADIAHGANPALHNKLPYDTLKDFTPVVLVAELPAVLLVHPSVRAVSVRELVESVKKQPGKLNYASSGFGSANHLAAELFKSELGLDIVHVPYQGGGQAMNAILSGQAQILFITIPASLPHIKAEKVRALAVTSAKRIPSLPDVPTVAETLLPGFEVNLWIGILAPARTPAAVVRRVNAEINKTLALPAVKERVAALGANIVGGTPEHFNAFIRKEIQRWGKTIKPNMRAE
jgi:tripartite-type tricarboxylate transporter receptor subunit TctC